MSKVTTSHNLHQPCSDDEEDVDDDIYTGNTIIRHMSIHWSRHKDQVTHGISMLVAVLFGIYVSYALYHQYDTTLLGLTITSVLLMLLKLLIPFLLPKFAKWKSNHKDDLNKHWYMKW